MDKSVGSASSGMASREPHGSGTRTGRGLGAVSEAAGPHWDGSTGPDTGAYRVITAPGPPGPPILYNPLRLHDLRWLDVPLEIYWLIIDQCSVKTLYNLCLVSKISREFAIPILYRCVDLCMRTGGKSVLACLRHLISSTSAKYCEELRLDLGRDWRVVGLDDPPESDLLLDSAVMCLAEFAIGKMPKLKTFRWRGSTLPDRILMCALQKCPNLANVWLDSDTWGTYEPTLAIGTPILAISTFAHLKSLRIDGITSTDVIIHEVRQAIENSPGLEDLHLEGCDEFIELGLELPLSDLFLRPRLSSEGGFGGEGRALLGRSLKQLTLVNFIDSRAAPMTERGLFSDIASSAFGHLDCLTLYDIDSGLLDDVGICAGLRLRKLRVQCLSWRPLTELLSCSELELLHIVLEEPGFDYDSLIPLVCKSKGKLRDLRLEWSPSIAGATEMETLSNVMAGDLVVKCLHLQHLGLRADFASGDWNDLCNLFAASLQNLVTFRLQRARPVPPPRASQSHRPDSVSRGVGAAGGGRRDGRGYGGETLLLPPMFSTLAGDGDGEYPGRSHYEWDAQEFATAFVAAAKTAAYEGGGSVVNGDTRINLQYVDLNNHYYEIWMREDKYVISRMSGHRARLFSSGFRRSRYQGYNMLLRVSQTD